MSKREKFLRRILDGMADANISFEELCNLLIVLGFTQRIKGSHHIFFRSGIMEILNIQPRGALAKPYQVNQVRTIIVKYKLGGLLYD